MAIKTRVLIPSRAPQSVLEHELIVSALRSRSPVEACVAAQEHVEHACRDYLAASGLAATPELEDWLNDRRAALGLEDSGATAL
jgi:DNA-binding GntR family transcriptional regulator